MIRSRSKGARGERDAAQAWAEVMGGQARRGQQFAGGNESPDVVTDYSGIHLEVKRTERGNPYDWIDQSVRDAGSACPVVLHRRNNQPWLLMVRLTDVPRLAAEITAKIEALGRGSVSCDVPSQGVPATLCSDGESPRVL